jgi:hypothetical protein
LVGLHSPTSQIRTKKIIVFGRLSEPLVFNIGRLMFSDFGFANRYHTAFWTIDPPLRAASTTVNPPSSGNLPLADQTPLET